MGSGAPGGMPDANTFTGGVTIDDGTLELSNSAAGGSGAITFAPGAIEAIVGMVCSVVSWLG
jgi:hypothetical protein